jgi:hypothetical protein
MIERKFNMFSTKEWLQFLQYKISPEREKELIDKSTTDPFLREAIETISTQEFRPIAFQSLSYLIGQVEDATGVSESNITSEKISRRKDPTMNRKLVLLVGGILVLGLVAFGVYYLISNKTEVIEAEEMNAMETLPASEMVDTSSKPFDVIPNTTVVIDTATKIQKSTVGQTTVGKKKTSSGYNEGTSVTPSTTTESKSTGVSTTPAISSKQSSEPAQGSKERELFGQAQDMFKQGNRDGAKQILNQLNSYDNPMKSQSGKILENMKSAGN